MKVEKIKPPGIYVDSVGHEHDISAKALLAIACLSLFALFLAMSRDLRIIDEGIVLTDAMRVINGDVIHRDFYSPYGPAQYYVVAVLLRLFGTSAGFMAARLYDLTVRAFVAVTLFYIIRRRCSLTIALVFTGVGGSWLLGIGYYLYPIFPCILLSLVGSYLIMGVGEERSLWPKISIAGVCTGFTALFRYDIGFELLIAHVTSMVLIVALSNRRKKEKVHYLLRAAGAYVGGTAAVFVPAAIVFVIASPIGPFVSDIIDYPSKYY